MEDHVMSMEIVRKGDNFTASEIACRAKVSTRCAKVILDGLVDSNRLVSEVRKSYTVYRLRVTPFINTLKLSNWQPRDETFRGWL
jgi:hypothetical protein